MFNLFYTDRDLFISENFTDKMWEKNYVLD